MNKLFYLIIGLFIFSSCSKKIRNLNRYNLPKSDLEIIDQAYSNNPNYKHLNLKGMASIIIDDEETKFIMKQTDDILSASLRNNLDAPYSCQGGVCSSCLCKVTEGKAVMVKNSILSDSEIEEGLVLACQAFPTTPNIAIDFDDV